VELEKMLNNSFAIIKAAVEKKFNEISKQISAAFDFKGKKSMKTWN
jgi:hypothetical protein